MSKLKNDIVKLFNRIFRKNNIPMLASATSEIYEKNNESENTLPKSSQEKTTIYELDIHKEKMNRYLDSLYMKDTVKTPKQIISDLLQSDEYKRVYEKHPEINELINGWREKSKNYTYKDKLELLRKDYSSKLNNFSNATINNAMNYLENRHSNHGKSENDIELTNNAKKIFELMHEYENNIKNIFADNNIKLTHITNVPPDKLEGGVLRKSIDRANNYETERVDGVFASSIPIDGNNPYIARNNTGMIRLNKSTYVYGDDNIDVYQDDNGKNRACLKKPNYIYYINPKKFNPVCSLTINSNTHKPEFVFSEEWISNSEINISDPNQVRKIEQVKDITSLLEHYTILCDVQSKGIGIQAKHSKTKEEAFRLIENNIKDVNIRNINHETGINDRALLDYER